MRFLPESRLAAAENDPDLLPVAASAWRAGAWGARCHGPSRTQVSEFPPTGPFADLECPFRGHGDAPDPGRALGRYCRAQPGPTSPTARRWSPATGAATARWCCSTSRPRPPGRTSPSPAASWRCCARIGAKNFRGNHAMIEKILAGATKPAPTLPPIEMVAANGMLGPQTSLNPTALPLENFWRRSSLVTLAQIRRGPLRGHRRWRGRAQSWLGPDAGKLSVDSPRPQTGSPPLPPPW